MITHSVYFCLHNLNKRFKLLFSMTAQPISNEDTRSKLLSAGLAIFADRGYHGATVREICQLAKVNVALVNYHFGDKLGLYTEVLRRAMSDEDRMRRALELFVQDSRPEAILRNVIGLMLEQMIQRKERGPANMRLMLHELARPTPAINKVVDESVKPVYDRLLSLVGTILELPPKHEKTRLCTQSIIGQVIHYAKRSPVVARLWPELKMTAAQRGVVANHIAEFSLAYLQTCNHTEPASRLKRMKTKRA